MYTDLLTQIRNAQQAKKASLKMPYSDMDLAIAEILVKKGFLTSVSKKGRMPKRIMEIELKYEDDKGVINGVKFLSVPSRRLYCGHRELRPVRQGYGTLLISTPNGVLTINEARKQKVGGQLLFEIW